jgi:hypothetical protein
VQRLADKQMLVVLDDISSVDVVRAVNTLGVHMLVTTVQCKLGKKLQPASRAATVCTHDMRLLTPASARMLLQLHFNFSVRLPIYWHILGRQPAFCPLPVIPCKPSCQLCPLLEWTCKCAALALAIR